MFPYHLANDIQLRLLQKQHAQELFRVTDVNRDHLLRWLPWLDETQSEEDSAAFIASSLRAFADVGTFVCGIGIKRLSAG
jgi:ribosomal-protein-serine acetyltransferase